MLSAKALNGPLAIGDAGADADAKAAPVRTMRIQPQLKVCMAFRKQGQISCGGFCQYTSRVGADAE